MLYQFISLVGAVMVLGAYFAYQRGVMGKESQRFNALNFVGAALVTVAAAAARQWGIVLLEATWSLLSLHALLKQVSSKKG